MISARAWVVTMRPLAPRGRASLFVFKVGFSLLIFLLLVPAGLLAHEAPPGGLPGSSVDRATLPALSSVMAGATATITPSPTSGCPHTWQVVDSPGVWYATLYAVSASSATDIWAVGLRRSGQNTYQTLTDHRECTAWSVMHHTKVGMS